MGYIMMFYTYILECADGSFYTGWTNNLTNRLDAHNKGTGAKYTRGRAPVRLVYYEEHADKKAAQKREYGIKRLRRMDKQELIDSFKQKLSLENTGLNKDKGEMLMEFKFVHNNFNVLDLERSIAFYKEALQLQETRRMEKPEFTLVFLGEGKTPHKLELTWIKERKAPYNLGDNEFHLAFTVDDFEKAFELHKQMGCICYENKATGIYFISDPDGYWLEILPEKR